MKFTQYDMIGITNHFQLFIHTLRMGFELTSLVVTGTDYNCSFKSNHHTITTMAAPLTKDIII